MMKKIISLLIYSEILLLASTALAQDSEGSGLPEWLRLGADVRLRNEYTRATQSLDPAVVGSEQNTLRARLRGWFQLRDSSRMQLRLNMRLAYEPRYWTKGRKETGRRKTEWRYALPDILNLTAERPFGLPVVFTLGRQELTKGGNCVSWLWGDGTATDGSYTAFFDAFRAVYSQKGLTAELVLIDQRADPSDVAFQIGHAELRLREQNERGMIMSLFKTLSGHMRLGGFFVHKHDDRVYDQTYGFDGNTYTVGGHLSKTVSKGLGFRVEAAYQFGHRKDSGRAGFRNRDVSAYGMCGEVYYEFGDARKNRLSFIMEYFSGDDPSDDKDGMFDVLWGRQTRWTDVVGSTFVPETGRNYQYSNLHRLCLEWKTSPLKDMGFTLGYNVLLAPEKVPTRMRPGDAGSFSCNGHFRGHLLRAMLEKRFSRRVKAHLIGEALFQGNYYTERHCLSFARVELVYQW